MQENAVLARTYLLVFPFGSKCAIRGCGAEGGTLEISSKGIIKSTCCSPDKQHTYSMCQLCGKLISSDNLWRHQNYGNSCPSGVRRPVSDESKQMMAMVKDTNQRASQVESAIECASCKLTDMQTDLKSGPRKRPYDKKNQ